MQFAKADPVLAAEVKENKNFDKGADGLGTRLVNRSGLSDDIYSAYGRSDRIVARAEALFGERLRHFYHLNMQKEPREYQSMDLDE